MLNERSPMYPCRMLLTRKGLAVVSLAIGAAVATGGLNYAGCNLPRGGLMECGDIEVKVTPRFICPGDPVSLMWEVHDPRIIPCEDFFDLAVGEGCVGTIDESFEVFITSNPEPIFDGARFVDRRGATGVETVAISEDTTVEFTVFRRTAENRRVVCVPDSKTVNVLRPESLETFDDELRFTFGCTAGEGGTPGWGAINIERNERASSSVHIQNVRNRTRFAIRLSLQRDTDDLSIPPLVTVDLGALGTPTDTSTAIQDEYFGLWTAVPLSPDPVGPSGCDGTEPNGNVVSPPDGDGTVLVPQPDIVVDVAIGCAQLP